MTQQTRRSRRPTKDTKTLGTRVLRSRRALRGFGRPRRRTSPTRSSRRRAAAARSASARRPAPGGVADVPLEVYVARVLAGEAEPRAPDGEFQALAIAIRTYALVNAGRHARDGFDVCDSTHCQVPRAANALTRARGARDRRPDPHVERAHPRRSSTPPRAAAVRRARSRSGLAPTIPTCGRPPDDVHDEDVPWTFELTLAGRAADPGAGSASKGGCGTWRSTSATRRAGRRGCACRECSPNVIAGDQFRLAVGAARVRSTAFSVEQRGSTLRFTGRGYGHGVGMCVIGAGRRAARGEDVRAILAHYYPGLDVTRAWRASPVGLARRASSGTAVARTAGAVPAAPRAGIVATVPSASSMTNAEVLRLAARAHDDLCRGARHVHRAADGARASIARKLPAGHRPSVVGEQRLGRHLDRPRTGRAARAARRLRAALRIAVAELLVADALKGPPRLGPRRRRALLRARVAGACGTAPPRRRRSVSRRCRVDAGDLGAGAARRRSARRSLLCAGVRPDEGLAHRPLSHFVVHAAVFSLLGSCSGSGSGPLKPDTTHEQACARRSYRHVSTNREMRPRAV